MFKHDAEGLFVPATFGGLLRGALTTEEALASGRQGNTLRADACQALRGALYSTATYGDTDMNAQCVVVPTESVNYLAEGLSTQADSLLMSAMTDKGLTPLQKAFAESQAAAKIVLADKLSKSLRQY